MGDPIQYTTNQNTTRTAFICPTNVVEVTGRVEVRASWRAVTGLAKKPQSSMPFGMLCSL